MTPMNRVLVELIKSFAEKKDKVGLQGLAADHKKSERGCFVLGELYDAVTLLTKEGKESAVNFLKTTLQSEINEEKFLNSKFAGYVWNGDEARIAEYSKQLRYRPHSAFLIGYIGKKAFEELLRFFNKHSPCPMDACELGTLLIYWHDGPIDEEQFLKIVTLVEERDVAELGSTREMLIDTYKKVYPSFSSIDFMKVSAQIQFLMTRLNMDYDTVHQKIRETQTLSLTPLPSDYTYFKELIVTKFSTFSIYEKEMRFFINALAEQSGIDIKKLTEWMYDTGVNVYQKSQGALYYPYSTACQAKFGHRPLISFAHSQGQHYTGLIALKDELIKVFSESNTAVKEIIASTFDKLLLPAIAAHSPFIKIESEVASDFNEFLDKHGELSPIQSLEKVIELFRINCGSHPNLYEDFDNKLILMGEVLAEMKKTSMTTKVTPSNQFFKATSEQIADAPLPSTCLEKTGPN